jgi:hypothetical protein
MKPRRISRERVNLYLTKGFAEKLFELRRRKLKAALAASAGAWKDKDHPEMMTGEDIDHWIEENRRLGTRDWSEEWGQNEQVLTVGG